MAKKPRKKKKGLFVKIILISMAILLILTSLIPALGLF
jgi:flagellar basal body-associated protein FliL